MSPTTDLPSVAVRQAALEADFAPWQPRSLDRLLGDVAQRHPDRPVVISDAHAWTYAQMDAWVDRLATGLRAVGVRGGEHVGLILGNYPEFVAVKFAIARVGAVAVPINTMNRRDEIAFILRQADVALLVTMDQFRGLNYLEALDSIAPDWATAGGGAALPALRRVVVFPTGETRLRDGVTTLSALDSTAGALPPVDPSSLCDIIFTSGTTGAPKGVMLTHDMMLRTAYGSAHGRAFADGQRILFSLPLYHVFGYVEGLLAALFAGGAVVPQLKFTAEDTLEGIARHAATDVLLVPTMSLALLDLQRQARRALPTLRTALASGGKAPAYLWDDLRTWLGIAEITTGYGMTECTASATVT